MSEVIEERIQELLLDNGLLHSRCEEGFNMYSREGILPSPADLRNALQFVTRPLGMAVEAEEADDLFVERTTVFEFYALVREYLAEVHKALDGELPDGEAEGAEDGPNLQALMRAAEQELEQEFEGVTQTAPFLPPTRLDQQ